MARLIALVWLLLAVAAADIGLRAPRAAAQEAPDPLRVVYSGFVVEPLIPCPPPPPDAPRHVLAILRVENPNANWAAEGIEIAVRLLGPDRSSLAATEIQVSQLLPAEQRILSARFELARVPPGGAAAEVAIGEPSGWRRVGWVPRPGVMAEGGLTARNSLGQPTFV